METGGCPGAPAPVSRRRLGLTLSPRTAPSSRDLAAHGDRDALRHAVLGFGRRGLRPLPWRATRDPWAVLVSEVMLQQTQVARVVDPYHRFMERFPTPSACARAGLGAVLVAWAGLGYNRRAQSLHAAAEVIVARHGGKVPSELDDLVALPGVGPYTARAVLAFASERPVAVVDTNIRRLLARALVGRPLSQGAAQGLADELVPPRAAWLWNQSLMEIGALVCRARRPACSRCPVRSQCAWRASGSKAPDPGAPRTVQSRFDGSDRQGRGRLVQALRSGPVRPSGLAFACGWPEDPGRAERVADSLVTEGVAHRGRGGTLALP